MPEGELPRTEYGHPDLQGIWNYTTLTPSQRPEKLGEKLVYSRREARRYAREASANLIPPAQVPPDRPAPEAGSAIGSEAELVFSDHDAQLTRVDGKYRTSLIVDPPDGRFPFLENGRENDIYGQWRAQGFESYEGPENSPVGERCLSALLSTMPPMHPLPYNSNLQVVQNKDYVMMLGEMVHDARIIRLNGRHRPPHIKLWFGDSIGHWEGDTLVVHTTNFHPQNSNMRLISSEQLEITERFTRISEDEIFYTYEVRDPAIYSRTFSVEMILKHLAPGQQMYEFACHEGNYSMKSILAGARRQEVEPTQSP